MVRYTIGRVLSERVDQPFWNAWDTNRKSCSGTERKRGSAGGRAERQKPLSESLQLRCTIMDRGNIEIICGDDSSGKTALALGKSIQALTRQKQVIMIQFLKGSQKLFQMDAMKRLEPELKIFRFEKSENYFRELSEEQKQEETINIRNGLNYAKKVLSTGECDLLVLDEVLGLLDLHILSEEELEALLECRSEADVILTGKLLPASVRRLANRVEYVQVDNYRR